MDGENNNIDDLDDDLDDEESKSSPPTKSEEDDKEGQQDDGSVVVTVADDEEDDSKAADSQEDEDTEAEAERERIREQRRQERVDKKRRQREREERMQLELRTEREQRRQLEERIAIMERKSSGAEMASLEAAHKQTKQAYDYYKDQIKVAHEAGNGSLAAEATEKMMLSAQRLEQLNRIKESYQNNQNKAPPLDERLVNNANSFMAKHPWYRADSRDNDSLILRTLDNAVAGEGWDPTTEAYWEELENRIKKYLPHRAKNATVQSNDKTKIATRQKSVVTGSGSETQAVVSGGKNTFTLSPARVQAIKDAGMWDDPKKLNLMVKRYREYDKQQKGSKS